VVHLPAFALERCGYLATDCAVCVDEVKNATRIVALTPAARAEGLSPGMTVSEARALAPQVQVEPHDPVGERADHQALVAALADLSDRLAPWGAGDVLLEASTTAHLFGGETGLMERALERVAELGHAVRVAIADDVRAAAALARWSSRDRRAPPGEGAAALAELPLQALEPSPELRASLEVLGLRRIGQLADLDPASIAGRFGEEGIALHRLARGLRVTRLPWRRPEGGLVAERVVLGGPTLTLEPIHFVLPGLLARLGDALAARDALAVRLAVHLILERGPAHVARVRVGRPTRAPERLERLVRARLERIRLDAPAVELLIEVEEDTAEQAWQPGLLDRTEAAEAVPDLVARLADALGPDALHGVATVDAWRPEAAWAPRPFAPGTPPARPPPHRKADRDPVAEQRRFEEDGPRPRPGLLLPRPERIEVQHRGGRPERIRLEGAWCRVARCAGPERLEGSWWHADGGFHRDYWVVGLGGRTGWCFLDDQGRWFLHGWFD